MLRIAYLFLVAVQCRSSCIMDGSSCRFWGYGASNSGVTENPCGIFASDKCGPKFWSVVEPAAAECGGNGDQSPINADLKTALHLPHANLALSPPTACMTRAQFVVNAHTVQVDIPVSCRERYMATWTSSSGALGGESKSYVLQHYNFHTPSEHTVDGAYFEMEAHHVHQAADGSTLILAVFMKVDPMLAAKCGDPNQPHTECSRATFFNRVLLGGRTEEDLLQQVRAAQSKVKFEAPIDFDPYTHFIPPMLTHFYTYTGSFTTPPCTTGVTWILNPTPVVMFESSFLLYKRIIQSYPSNQLSASGANNRPLQPMGARKLYYVGTSVATTTPLPVPVTETPAPIRTSTPSATTTPRGSAVGLYARFRRDALTSRSSNMVWLGIGCLIGTTLTLGISGVRSRLSYRMPSYREMGVRSVVETFEREACMPSGRDKSAEEPSAPDLNTAAAMESGSTRSSLLQQ